MYTSWSCQLWLSWQWWFHFQTGISVKVYSLWWSICHVRKIGMFLCLLIVSGSNLNKVSEEWLFPFMLIKNSVCLSRIGIYNKFHERVHVCSCSILSVPKHKERLCFLKFSQIRYAGGGTFTSVPYDFLSLVSWTGLYKHGGDLGHFKILSAYFPSGYFLPLL